jgi:hypothetical protein
LSRLLGLLLCLGILPAALFPWASGKSSGLLGPGERLAYAFASDLDGDGEVYAVLEDGELLKVTNNAAADWGPALSRDGRMLAWTSRAEGAGDIITMDLSTGQKRNRTRSPFPEYEPAWCGEDGSLVFVSEESGERDVYRLSSDGHRQRLTSSGPGEMCRSPACSPDGTSVAYSCVRGGVENIFLLLPDGSERQLTQWPLKGRFPTWSPDGSAIAFAGWDESADRPGLYVVHLGSARTEWLWQGGELIRSLNWAGEHILFSMLGQGGFDIYALKVGAAHPSLLASSPGWDDCPSAGTGALPPVRLGARRGVLAPRWLPPVFGVNIADLSNVWLARLIGAGWIKNYLSWAGVQPEPDSWQWQDPDNVIKAAERAGLKVLLRLHETPSWARATSATPRTPPSSLAEYEAFVTRVAERYRGRVAAYEIWNEPNLSFEWGDKLPQPELYAQMLCTAYRAIKRVDPQAIVVSGGLATTGEGGPGSMGDLSFLKALYAAGGRGCFDALGSHPYGYGLAPFAQETYGFSVGRVRQQREVMLAFGDSQTPIWATEMGWPILSPWDMGEHSSYAVTEQEQALFLLQLRLGAGLRWPWLQAMFLFNLDFSTVPWYETQQPMRWYALLEGDGSPRLAFSWLSRSARR